MPTIKVVYSDGEETVNLYLDMGNGFNQIAYANYDEHGSSGLDMITNMAYELSRITDWELIYEYELVVTDE